MATLKNFIKGIKYFIRKINASKIGAFSAQTAFFMFLSFIPLILLFLNLSQKLGANAERLIYVSKNFAPDFLNAFIETYIPEILTAENRSMTIISALVLLWSGSKGLFSIIGGLNSVYGIKENRNYFVLRLTAMLYTALFILSLIVALVLFVFGAEISKIIYLILPNPTVIILIITSLRFFLGFLILGLFFTVIYHTLPCKSHSFSDQIPGAMIASAGWISYSLLFSSFIENFSNYSSLYGRLTATIVLLLWLYNCMYIMFVGAEINQILSIKI